MKKLTVVVVFCLMINFSKAGNIESISYANPSDYCQDNFTISDFPDGILQNFLSLVIEGTVHDFVGCLGNESVSNSDVKFWYYSRNNPTVPVLLDQSQPTQIDSTKPIIILIPGWLCNVTNDRMPQLRDAYLKRYDANIIGVDWTAHSIALYGDSFCHIPGVAKVIGQFLCHISEILNVDLSKVHVLGHSMGGQISGITGQEVHKQCNKELGRITGLDPAGPLYQGQSIDQRLDGSDAIQVDIIHSNMAFLGYWGKCGTVDFYPNCGTFQPDCFEVQRNTTVSKIINSPLSDVGCNHLRSIDYMIESINSGKFTSKSCKLCPGAPIVGPCVADILLPTYALMGEDCPPNPKDTQYYLTTNGKPPFAKG